MDPRPRLPALRAGIAVALSALRLAAGDVDLFAADERQCGERASGTFDETDDKKIATQTVMGFDVIPTDAISPWQGK